MDEPVKQDIADSMAAFTTKDPNKRRIIEAVLSVIPRAPRSTLYRRELLLGFGGERTGGEGGRSGGVPRRTDAAKSEVGLPSRGHKSGHDDGVSGSGRRDDACSVVSEEDDGGDNSGSSAVCEVDQRRGRVEEGARSGVRDIKNRYQPEDGAGGRADREKDDDDSRKDDGRVRKIRGEDSGRLGGVGHPGEGHGDGGVIRVIDHDNKASTSGGREESPGGITGNVLALHIAYQILLSGSVVSSPWNELWRQHPLVFHDLDLARIARPTDGGLLERSIRSMLDSHPGPVRYFRLDSCLIKRGSDELEEWLEMLSRKQAQEIVIANCKWPAETMEFPLQSLDCGSLQILRLCFFRIPYIWLTSQDSNPYVIDLAGCKITEGDLWALVRQCNNLRELDSGLRDEGCIRIESESLESLQIWWSAIPNLTIENAPKLKKVIVGAPLRMTSSLTWIVIEGTAPMSLEHMWFDLSSQRFMINKVNIRWGHSAIPSMRTLELTMACRVEEQRNTLLNFLKSCTGLRELIIWRGDEPTLEEECQVIGQDFRAQLKDIHCLVTHLKMLSLKSCKGGATEIVLATTALEHASNLRRLSIITDPDDSGTGDYVRRVLEHVERPFPPVEMHFD